MPVVIASDFLGLAQSLFGTALALAALAGLSMWPAARGHWSAAFSGDSRGRGVRILPVSLPHSRPVVSVGRLRDTAGGSGVVFAPLASQNESE